MLSAKQQFLDIAAAMSDPKGSPGWRWASEYNDGLTATAVPWALFPNTSNGGGSTAGVPILPITDGCAFVFRCAERAYVVYNPNPAGKTYTYQAYFANDPQPPSTSYPPTSLGGVGEVPFAPAYWNAVSTFTPHGSTLFCGTDGLSQYRYMYMEAGVVVTATTDLLSGLSSANEVVLYLRRWVDGSVYDIAENATQGTGVGGLACTVTVPANKGGYIAVTFSVRDHTTKVGNPAVNVGFQSLKFEGANAVFEHHCLPGYENNVGSADGTRIMSASCMLSNDASPLNRQGKIAMVQSPEKYEWTHWVDGGFQAVSSAQGSQTLVADNGMYGFLKPTKTTDFDFYSYSDTIGGNVVASQYPLKSETAYLVCYFQCVNAAASTDLTTPTQDFHWTIAYGCEYQTADIWRSLDVSIYSADVCRKALEQLKNIPQFHENPLHVAEIWQKIKSLAKSAVDGIIKWGPTVLKGAAAIGGML